MLHERPVFRHHPKRVWRTALVAAIAIACMFAILVTAQAQIVRHLAIGYNLPKAKHVLRPSRHRAKHIDACSLGCHQDELVAGGVCFGGARCDVLGRSISALLFGVLHGRRGRYIPVPTREWYCAGFPRCWLQLHPFSRCPERKSKRGEKRYYVLLCRKFSGAYDCMVPRSVRVLPQR